MQFEDPRPLFLLFLFLHIGGAIMAFGPSFAMPIIGAAGGREPQHANFAIRLGETIAKQRVTPLAIFVGITGVLLILTSGRSPGELWLSLAIAIYVFALVFSFVVAAPNTKKLIEATSGGPPAAPAPGSPPPAGPPPHIAGLVGKAQRNGMVLGLLVVLILLLMVFKPTL
jgi:hypothetical protein